MSNLVARQKSASAIAADAGRQFNEVQVEANTSRIIAAERVGWFCAGAISLSFTLVGYLFSNSDARHVLSSEIIRGLPLIGFLILGWMNLTISILASLLVRLWNANYLTHNSGENWASKKRIEKENTIVFMEEEPDGLAFLDADTMGEAAENTKQSRDRFANLERGWGRKSNFWLKVSNLAQASIYTGALVGLMLLSTFLMLVTYQLVYS